MIKRPETHPLGRDVTLAVMNWAQTNETHEMTPSSWG